MSALRRIGDFSLVWGESVRWDERRGRLYFVDCAANTLFWLEGAEPPLQSLTLPGMPCGVVLADDGRLVIALDDGLHVVDVGAGSSELLALYPEGMGGRANDACADLDGGVVTGTLNIGPGEGSVWRWSVADGWAMLADGIANTNGPVVTEGRLVVADTPASSLSAWDYAGGVATRRRPFLDTAPLGAMPDGACADVSGGVWSCMLGAGTIVRVTDDGVQERVDSEVELPSDVTFGGPGLDTLFYVSIAVPIAGVTISSPYAGALMAVDGLVHRGRVEPRARL